MIAAWVKFWDRREAPTSLAVTRVLVGAVLLSDLLTARALGLVPDVWAPPPAGMGLRADETASSAIAGWLGAGVRTAELTSLSATLFAAMLFTGTLTRVSGIGYALASAELARLAPSADRGIDMLLRVAAVILALSEAGSRFSVDAAIRRAIGRTPPALAPAWPRYLLFGQIVWVYFSAVLHRGGSAWWPSGSFSALALILNDPHYARLAPGWTATVYPLTQLATAATMLFESSAPLLIVWTFFDHTRARPGWLRARVNRLRLRWAWLVLGIGFHLGIAVTLRLGIFPFGMLALYPALLHPDELASLGRKALNVSRPRR